MVNDYLTTVIETLSIQIKTLNFVLSDGNELFDPLWNRPNELSINRYLVFEEVSMI